MSTCLRAAFLDPAVAWRALKYAVVVGPVLIVINHGEALLEGHCGNGRLCSIGLTMVVPYLVSTFSSVGTMRQVRDDSRATGREPRADD